WDREMEISGAMPVTCNVRGAALGPGQLLRGLLKLYAGVRTNRSTGDFVCSGENLPAIAKEAYFQENGFTRIGLYPPDFTGRQICTFSRSQSWSWKPAIRVSGA